MAKADGKLTLPAFRKPATSSRFDMLRAAAAELDTREEFVQEISRRWQNAQADFLAIGRYLNQAKAKLAHGEWEDMVARDLPFGRATAHQLRAVAALVDTGGVPEDRLPKAAYAAYQVATLSAEERRQALEQGVIHPNMRRSDLIAFKKHVRGVAGPRREDSGREDERPALLAELVRLRARQREIQRRLLALRRR